jgi:molybdopterin-containing oxidoreductase family iron-sulfur binding subunit
MSPDTQQAQRPEVGPELWRSLEEWMDTPEFREHLEREFPDDLANWTDPVTRRQFLTLMGASLALAGVAGCSPRAASPRKIFPYVHQPERITPGVPLYFATAMPLGGVATGLLVKSQEGRPIKVEGNPTHPGSLGATDLFSQASVLGLYDPDRSRDVTRLGEPSSWDTAIVELRKQFHRQRAENKGGAGLRILTETLCSPSLIALIEELLTDATLKGARWVQYDPAGRDSTREGIRQAFGRFLNPVFHFAEARVVLSLDADFLSCEPGTIRYQYDFASRRRVRLRDKDGIAPDPNEMLRLYVVESMMTNTGASADHRLPLRSSDIEAFAAALAAALGVGGAPSAGELSELARSWIQPIADDLKRAGKRGLVVAGETQPPAVHALAHAINSTLGAIGTTVTFTAPLEARPKHRGTELKELVDEMKGGKVEMLLILGSNPLYNASADLEFAAALDKVPFRVHLGLHQDETASLCHWHIPEAHYLESWGDARAFDGTVSIIQPLIAPLYKGHTAAELLAALAERPERTGLEIVRAYWQRQSEQMKRSESFETFWQRSLQEGIVRDTALPAEANLTLAKDWAGKSGSAPKGTELVFRTDPTLYDGRFANNGWLQELPKPISKLTWDNAAFMSKNKAEALGISATPRWRAGERGRMEVPLVELNYKGRKVKAAAWVIPGHAEESITVYLGHGRERAGQVGTGTGFNAYALRTSDAPWIGNGVEITKTDEETLLACYQFIYSMRPTPSVGDDRSREPVRRGTLERLKENPTFAKVPPQSPGETGLIYQNVPGPGERIEKQVEPPRRGPLGHTPHPHEDTGREHPIDFSHPNGEGHNGKHEDSRLIPLTLYPDTNKEGRRWGMAIDLSTCTGCSACIVACQSENNIAVVGKTEMTRARDMLWLRIDRYFEGDFDKPETLQTYMQPVPCMQCEKAPCELVCPVHATAHSADGLNDMIYNRCVGTRYCSNNCPYKVRRFNFFTYSDYATESLKLLHNPEVTVRSRGVMEKCTYCVQRIRGAEIEAEREGRPIRDGEILTACQAACPSQAIIFGDIDDVNSAVRRWKAEPHNYGLMAELNTMPRTTYLASIRNPNPKMPKGA